MFQSFTVHHDKNLRVYYWLNCNSADKYYDMDNNGQLTHDCWCLHT